LSLSHRRLRAGVGDGFTLRRKPAERNPPLTN